MTVQFRNITVSAADPVADWGVEGLLTAIDRGTIAEWTRIVEALRADPWSDVAQDLTEALDLAEDVGVVNALQRALEKARADTDTADRTRVAQHVRSLITVSGLSQREFAARIGTSASRLSTYANGRVVPSAVLMERMRRVGARSRTRSTS